MAKKGYNELDFTCAVARLRALETRLLGTVELEKIINSTSVDESQKMLAGFGFKVSDNYEEMLDNELNDVFNLIESIGGKVFLKTQQIKYDYNNLKALIKGELTEQNSDNLLTQFGTIKTSAMKSAVLNRDYSIMTDNMKSSIPMAYEQYARINDVQLLDMIFDAAMFRDTILFANKLPEEKILDLIKMQIDIFNIKTFVRVRKMNKTFGFIENALADGGYLPLNFFISRINVKAENESSLFDKTPYSKAFTKIEELELALDNLFMEKVKFARLGAFGLAPVAAYFFIKENEIRNIRIILTCKKAGISSDEIRRRIRG